MLAEEMIKLAEKHLDNSLKGGSARRCLEEAKVLERAGFEFSARAAAIRSLMYSVGKDHPDYKAATAP